MVSTEIKGECDGVLTFFILEKEGSKVNGAKRGQT